MEMELEGFLIGMYWLTSIKATNLQTQDGLQWLKGQPSNFIVTAVV